MSPAEQRLLNRIRSRAATLQPHMSRRLLAAYDVIRQSLTEAELVRAIDSGAADQLIQALLDDRTLDPAFRPLRELVDRAAVDEGASWAKQLPGRVAAPTFDFLNPRVLTAIQNLNTRAVQGLKTEVRETVREAVRLGLESGKNPRVVARSIKDAIGLGPNQTKAVANFRAQLEAGDRAALQRMLGKGKIRTPGGRIITRQAHAGGSGLTDRQLAKLEAMLGKEKLTPEQIDKLVEAYRKRMLAWNTESHTRSMALDSQRLAARNSWQNAVDQGFVDVALLYRKRIETLDERTRPHHALPFENGGLNGEEAHFNAPYSNGETIAGESEYNCRAVERFFLARKQAGVASDKTPQTLFHAAPAETLRRIRQEGLLPQHSQKVVGAGEGRLDRSVVFGFSKLESAIDFASDQGPGDFVIFRINSRGIVALPDPEYPAGTSFGLPGAIPPSQLRVVFTSRKWRPRRR